MKIRFTNSIWVYRMQKETQTDRQTNRCGHGLSTYISTLLHFQLWSHFLFLFRPLVMRIFKEGYSHHWLHPLLKKGTKMPVYHSSVVTICWTGSLSSQVSLKNAYHPKGRNQKLLKKWKLGIQRNVYSVNSVLAIYCYLKEKVFRLWGKTGGLVTNNQKVGWKWAEVCAWEQNWQEHYAQGEMPTQFPEKDWKKNGLKRTRTKNLEGL